MDTLFNLTAQQQNIWNTEMFFSGSSVNNLCGYINIDQKVDFAVFEKAVNLYVKHTDSLRYHIILDGDKVLQHATPYKPFKIDTVGVNDMNEMVSLATSLLDIPFDVVDSDLFKFTMYRFPDGKGGLIGVFHHLIGDAWAMSLLISRIMDMYSALLKNEDNFNDFPTYSSYISSASDYLSSPKFEKDKTFWNAQFDSLPEHTFIYNKNSIPDVSGAREVCTVDNDLYDRISAFCKEHSVSTYSFFMAIYLLYLAKINNTKSALVGTPVLNRSNFAEKQIAGMFVSNVPFKIDIDSSMNFVDFVKSVALKQSSIFRHQKYPYMELLKYVKEKYDVNENLYDFVLSYQNARDNSTSSDIPYNSDWLSNTKVSNSVEAHFYDMDDSGKVNIYYNYQTAKFTASEIRAIHDRIIFMAESAITNPILKDIAVTTNSEMAFINDFNNTDFVYDKNESVVHAFERQVKKNNSSTAVVFKGSTLSYSELDKESNMLANMLIDKGVNTGDVIGIMFARGFNLHIAMWGILKAGASFMLIDPSLPEDRINYMLTNAKAKLVITDFFVNYETLDITERKNYADSLPSLNYGLSSDGDIVCHGDDRFCVLYTSGSTGTPKGVELRCKSVINLVNSFKEILHTNKCDVYLSSSTVSFDMFIVENFLSILSGKMVVLADEDEQKIPAFTSKLIDKYNVAFIVSTPSKISLLLSEGDCLKSIKVMQLGGEVLKPSLYRALRDVTDAEIHNGYGPSECFACSSNKFVTSENDVNIGKPYLNVKMFIMNSDNNILPPNVPGELVIGGDGVGLGYINNQILTSEKFTDINGNIFYHTGDIAMLSDSGELVYCGRKDNQIKLHGLRIELDEITAKLIALDYIKNAVSVIKKVNGIDCICSYVVTDNIDTSTSDDTKIVAQIKKDLSRVLPNYMVPSHVVILDSLPITLNGKVDVHNLPEIEISETAFVPCNTDLERALENIWKGILNLDKISANANFFELGGDSLCSIRLVSEVYSKFNKKIEIRDVFDYPTIAELAEFIDKMQDEVTNSFKSAKDSSIKKDSNGDSLFPASFAQKGIFYASSMDSNSTLYNTPFGILFDKVPDASNLEKAISKIINSHQAFRTSFVSKDGDVYQKVLDNIDFKLDVTDYKNDAFVKPFDLGTAPLMHIELNEFEGKAFLQLDIHHIICDGASVHIFAKELCEVYNSFCDGSRKFADGSMQINLDDINGNLDKGSNDTASLESVNKLDYLDYSLNEKINDSDRDYWLSEFKDDVPLLNMPTEFERGNILSFSGNSIYGKIENVSAINNFCKEYGVTPYMLLLSCFYVLLYKYTMQNDLIVGTPVSGRTDPRFSNVLGMFVNTIALKQNIVSSTSLTDFIQSVKNNSLEAFARQSYPFSELIKSLNISRDSSRHPLFDVMFIYESMGLPELNLKGLNSEYIISNSHSSKFDFSLEVTPYNDYFGIRLEYCDKLFGIKFMETLLDCYKNIVNAVLEKPDISISKINMLKNAPDVYNHLDIPKNLRVIDLFEKQVLETPDNTALVFGDESYTYKELEIKVNKLANYIRSLSEFVNINNHTDKDGVSEGNSDNKVIGIIMNRRAELIISILAVLKAGYGYLPIDPTYPEDRIKYILSDSHVNLLISEDALISASREVSESSFDKASNNKSGYTIYGITAINVDKSPFAKYEAFDSNASASDLCYMIYTSGSTGRPKGVMIKNSSVVNFIYGTCHDIDLKDKTVVNITTMCFDIFVFESLLPLCTGMKVVLANNDEQNNPILLNKLCLDNGVDVIQTTPSKFKLLMTDNLDYLKNLKVISLIGEPFPLGLLKSIKAVTNSRVYNMYGPTETTVGSTLKDLTDTNNITVGLPLANTHVLVLDNDLNPVPYHVPGTLYIGGDGVSLGYVNRPELTAEKFINYNGETIYNTGDLAKFLPNGELCCLGRTDFQVKIRGLRIELGEIESTICSYRGVKDAVVTVKMLDDREFLCGYFVSDGRVSLSTLKKHLSDRLPNYMVPSYLLQLDTFKYTPNGKIDRKDLPNPVFEPKKIIPPKTELESKILKIWKSILSISEISTDDNFFEIGGDSLCALRLQIELMKENLNINYGDIFKANTIAGLAEFFEEEQNVSTAPVYSKQDFKMVDKLLAKNSYFKPLRLKQKSLKNVLLVGATGFLGIHVLAELLKIDDINIYCLIRNDPSTSAENKLKNKFKYYFGSDLSNLFGKRLFVIASDVTSYDLGITPDVYELLAKNVSAVLNCAALVKHYGNYKDFEKINVTAVKNLVSFCEKYNKEFYQVSTISVSGNTMTSLPSSYNPKKKIFYGENKLFIGQGLDNVYVRSKFEAEKFVLEEISSGHLKGLILRVGNLTHRYVDGKFQDNSLDNAFLNRLKAFMYLKEMPSSMVGNYVEFSPVDKIAESIVVSMRYYTYPMSVLHLYNSNHLYIDNLLKILDDLGFTIDVVSDIVFKEHLNNSLFSNSNSDKVSVLLNDLDTNKNLVYKTNLKITNKFTLKFLSKADFTWPEITKDYIEKILKNL